MSLFTVPLVIFRDQKTKVQRKHRAAVLSSERVTPCTDSDQGSVHRLDVEEVRFLKFSFDNHISFDLINIFHYYFQRVVRSRATREDITLLTWISTGISMKVVH